MVASIHFHLIFSTASKLSCQAGLLVGFAGVIGKIPRNLREAVASGAALLHAEASSTPCLDQDQPQTHPSPEPAPYSRITLE